MGGGGNLGLFHCLILPEKLLKVKEIYYDCAQAPPCILLPILLKHELTTIAYSQVMQGISMMEKPTSSF